MKTSEAPPPYWVCGPPDTGKSGEEVTPAAVRLPFDIRVSAVIRSSAEPPKSMLSGVPNPPCCTLPFTCRMKASEGPLREPDDLPGNCQSVDRVSPAT